MQKISKKRIVREIAGYIGDIVRDDSRARQAHLLPAMVSMWKHMAEKDYIHAKAWFVILGLEHGGYSDEYARASQLIVAAADFMRNEGYDHVEGN